MRVGSKMPLIVVLVYLFLEVLVSVSVANYIGVFGFFLEIILSAVLGIGILINFRYFFAETFIMLKNRQLSNGGFLSANILRILGAILLILPGALTDIIGVAMQFYAIFRPKVPNNEEYTPTNSTRSINNIEIIQADFTFKENK